MAEFTVTRLDDAEGGDQPGLSLRQAITAANDAPGADTVRFEEGLSGTVTLTGGPLSIADGTDVLGPETAADDAPLIVVSADDEGRVLEVEGAVTLERLTIRDGFSETVGGGISVAPDGSLTLRDMVVRDHIALRGAAIHLGEGASLGVLSSEVSRNTAELNYDSGPPSGIAAGIYGAGLNTVEIVDSLFTRNNGDHAAGVFTDATVDIRGSSFRTSYDTHFRIEGASDLTIRDSSFSSSYYGGISKAGTGLLDIEVRAQSFPTDGSKGNFGVSTYLNQGPTRVTVAADSDHELDFSGGDGGAIVYGTDLADSLSGRSEPLDPEQADGADRFYGLGGFDFLSGGYGDDFLVGGADGDTMQGNAGDDTLVARTGDEDLVRGNRGNDVFAFLASEASDATVRLDDFQDGDRIALDDRLFAGTRFDGIAGRDVDPRDVTETMFDRAIATGVAEYDPATGILTLFRPDGDDPLGAEVRVFRADEGVELQAEDFLLF